MFKVSTMDSCKNLTAEKYIAAYDTLLSSNIDKISIKKGKIIFQTDFNFGSDSIFRKTLIELSEKRLDISGRGIREMSDSDVFVIELK